MAGELAGRVALVTGGGGAACGGAIARKFAAEGAAVVILERHEKRCLAMAEELRESLGARALGCVADIADRTGVDAALARAQAEIGPIDIVVNNAAENVQGSIFNYDPANLDRVLAVDFTACWYIIRQTIGGMRDRGRGSIVNISSVAAYIGGLGIEAPYSAAKAALHDLTRSVAIEGGPHGIRSNAIAVGMVWSRFLDTQMDQVQPALDITPLRRVARAEEIAEIALFLASERSSYITGEIINASGGYNLGQ
jgi:NAD(P)-dependent dehydrogenase (short-subunit alcohol dehydrogenase family)